MFRFSALAIEKLKWSEATRTRVTVNGLIRSGGHPTTLRAENAIALPQQLIDSALDSSMRIASTACCL